MRQAYLVEEFRYLAEGNGRIVERAVREPTVHVVGNPTNLIERTKRFFELQISNATSPSALRFGGVRIVRDSDGEIIFRATVREFWDAIHTPNSGTAGAKR